MTSRTLFIYSDKILAASNRAFLTAITFSVIFHGIALRLFNNEKALVSKPEKFITVETAEEITTTGNDTKKNSGPSLQMPGLAGSGRASKLSLKDLGINWNTTNGVALPEVSDTGSETFAEGGNGGGSPAAVQNAVSYQAIYERLDSAFYYPKEFQEAGIDGHASATLYFTAKGEWLKEKSSVNAPTSQYLKVFVIQLLRKTLTQPVIMDAKGLKEMKVRCEFHLEATRKENAWDPSRKAVERMDSRKAFANNHLYFYRYGKVLGEWSLGPLKGYALAPAVGIDAEWIGDQVGSLFSKKEKTDPLLKYRLDPAWE